MTSAVEVPSSCAGCSRRACWNWQMLGRKTWYWSYILLLLFFLLLLLLSLISLLLLYYHLLSLSFFTIYNDHCYFEILNISLAHPILYLGQLVGMCSILFHWAIGSSQVSHAFSGGFKGCKLMGKVCQFPPRVADCAEDLKYNPAKFFEATELRNEPWARTHECQVPSIFQLYPQSIPIISPLHPHSILSPWYPI